MGRFINDQKEQGTSLPFNNNGKVERCSGGGVGLDRTECGVETDN